MLVLGIESSCDETGVALYSTEHGLIGNQLHTQMAMHAEYGGVVPELASRDHIRRLVPLTQACLHEAGKNYADIDAVAYTQGPGLGGALLAGCAYANALAFSLGKPVIPVHHLEGHLLSPLLAEEKPAFPFVALLVSGGHTQFMAVRGIGDYELLGESVDDAAGEAFDKPAKLLGLPYPGGAKLSELAKLGRPDAFTFPRPMLHSRDLQMSFPGLKTAFLRIVQNLVNVPISYPSSKLAELLDETTKADLAASFDQAVTDILLEKITAAIKQNPETKSLVIAGGVSANQTLREDAKKLETKFHGLKCYFPLPKFSGDNAAMVASAAYYEILSGVQPSDPYKLNILPRSEIK